MSTDDKKTSPAPKNGAVAKKAVAAKKDEGQPEDKTTPDADRSKAESGEKAAGSPTRSIRASTKPTNPLCQVLVSESGRRSIQSLINEAGKCHPLF